MAFTSIGRSRTTVAAVAFAAMVLAGCGGDDDSAANDDEAATAPSTDEPTDSTTTTVATTTTAALVEPVLDGTPEVFTQDYGLPDTTGWDTVVAFRVSNPSDTDLVGVQYRADVASADGATSDRTTGDDTISLRANETRWAVARLDPTGATAPTTGNVSLYAAGPAGEDPYADPVHADTTLWESSNRFLDCDGFTVGCTATADVVFNGDAAQRIVDIVFIVHGGADGSGPLVFAGRGDVDGSTVQPGQTIPISGHVLAHHANEAGEELKGEVFVFSVPA